MCEPQSWVVAGIELLVLHCDDVFSFIINVCIWFVKKAELGCLGATYLFVEVVNLDQGPNVVTTKSSNDFHLRT